MSTKNLVVGDWWKNNHDKSGTANPRQIVKIYDEGSQLDTIVVLNTAHGKLALTEDDFRMIYVFYSN